MNQALDLLGGFTNHYATVNSQPKYSRVMANDIADRYSWIGERYKVAMYEEVLREFHPTQARPLPDMAALADAEKQLPDPASFVDHTKLLPEPDEPVVAIVDIVKHVAEIGQGNEFERQRVRDRIRRNDASELEIWWLKCIEEGKGYKKMPQAEVVDPHVMTREKWKEIKNAEQGRPVDPA